MTLRHPVVHNTSVTVQHMSANLQNMIASLKNMHIYFCDSIVICRAHRIFCDDG